MKTLISSFCLVTQFYLKKIKPPFRHHINSNKLHFSEKLAYLGNLPETGGEETFTMEIPDYKIQPRDILYITIKAMTPDGTIKDFLSSCKIQFRE